jgi:hypothetical protein
MSEEGEEIEMNEENLKQPDYLKTVFEALEKANQEMNKYGVTLQWEFKIAPYYPPVTKNLNGL